MRALRLPLLAALPALALCACTSTRQPVRRPPPAIPTTAEAMPPLPPYRRTECRPTVREAALAQLLVAEPRQRRTRLRCNGVLEAFARQRAEDMARRGYLQHRTPEGRFPNDQLRASYPVPRHYSKLGNQVEAIAAGQGRAAEVWRDWLGSEEHRQHVLGETEMYREQEEYGVGYAHNPHGERGDFWVLILARPARPDDPQLLCAPPPGPCFNLPPKLVLKP